jgi:hypothetical protein
MPGEYSHEHPVTIHEGPMADKRGTGWREDAAKLEALNQETIENPMQTLPNSATSIDKARALRAKGSTGTVDPTNLMRDGEDTVSTR